MSASSSPGLEFPAMLHGATGTIVRNLRTEGRMWGREYLQTGGFTQPRRMLQVPHGELLIMHAATEPDIIPRPRWRIHIFLSVFMSLNEGIPKEERQRMEESFESFCLSRPWGALYYAVSPTPPRSAERTVRRLAALLRSWDVLQGPRYTYRLPDTQHTLDELMTYIYGMALEAWCPGGPGPVREHLTRMVERMARATREDCLEAVLRVIPAVVKANTHLKHREELNDPDFLRERLAAVSPRDWEDVSSADRYSVNGLLCEWDRALGRH